MGKNKKAATTKKVAAALVETTEVNPEKVTLQVGEIVREFDYQHGMRILKMPNNGGWHLADKKENGSIDKNTDSREHKSTEEKANN